MNICYLDMEPHSRYSPLTLHLFPATRILKENPAQRDTNMESPLTKISKSGKIFFGLFRIYEIFCTPDSC